MCKIIMIMPTSILFLIERKGIDCYIDTVIKLHKTFRKCSGQMSFRAQTNIQKVGYE